MTPVEIGIIGFIVIFALLFLGLPVAFSLGLVGLVGYGLIVSGGAVLTKAATGVFEMLSNYDLGVLPLFILMAQVLFSSGIGKDLYDLASKWMGSLRGGLAMATIGASAAFAAVSASGVATTMTIGTVAIPEMKRHNYNAGLIAGSVVTGGTLGPLIPPSGLFIYYGIMTETSITKLFIAGIIPGIILAIFYIITIYSICLINPNLGSPGPRSGLKEKIMAFSKCGEILALIIFVIGGLTIGLFTPTEAGAIGAFGAIVLSIIRKRLTWHNFINSILETIKATGMIYAILIGVSLLTPFVAVTDIPFKLADFVTGLHIAPLLVMAVIIVIYLILGIVMDEAAMMFVTVPIFFPVVLALGFDPIWFGVVVVVMMMTATISPPLGINMYVVQAMDRSIPMMTIYKGSMPFMVANLLFVAILCLFPSICLFLPNITK